MHKRDKTANFAAINNYLFIYQNSLVIMKEQGQLKVLNLIIKQKYFDAIMAGRKVQEFREVRPTTIKKLLELDEEGYEKEDEDGLSIPIKYDAIRFFVGYSKDRDSALVEVTETFTQYFVDENNEIIEWQDEKGDYWQAQQVVYNLGRILEKDIKPKKSVKV